MNIFFDEEVAPSFFQDRIKELNPSSIFVLTDQNTEQHCLPIFRSTFLKGLSFHHLSIPAGEAEKNIDTCTRLWQEMISLHADRNTLLINLGGGVVTDLGGFLAALYKRGCQFINVPTTLLAMVDAAVGGKTGVDLGYLKNVIGTIVHPLFTYIHPAFLETLSKTELESGWAEVIKHALIADKVLWSRIRSQEKLMIPPYSILKQAVRIKAAVVEKDVLEKGERKTLNYGHTVGHAIESQLLSDATPVPHGYAVVTGMIIENIIAVEKGILKQEEEKEVYAFLKQHYTFINDFDPEKVVRNMLHDKKNANKEIRLSVVEGVGKAVYDVPCSEEEAMEALQKHLTSA